MGDIVSFDKLIQKISDTPNFFSYIKKGIPDDGKKILDRDNSSIQISDEEKNILIEGLNKLLKDDKLYNENKSFFSKKNLRKKNNRRLDGDKSEKNIVKRNRFLLEDAYPDEIVRSHFKFFIYLSIVSTVCFLIVWILWICVESLGNGHLLGLTAVCIVLAIAMLICAFWFTYLLINIRYDNKFGKHKLVCGRARSHILAGEMPAPEGWPATG